MALPILEAPTYITVLPSNQGKKNAPKLKFRPFLVAEEKILLMAQESGDPVQMMQAMKDVVRACTFGAIDPNALTTFDLEFIFLKLRIKSVGETASIILTCADCKMPIDIDVALDEVTVDHLPVIKAPIVQLTPNVGITLRYLTVADVAVLSDESMSKTDAITHAVACSIETIFDGANVHRPTNTPHAEMIAFIDSLSRAQMTEIESFIASTPKLSHVVKCECPKCKIEISRTLQGIQDFFA
jgi:hypothetical protein